MNGLLSWADRLANFTDSLGVMWKSMLGIFAVMIILIVSIAVLGRVTARAERKKAEKSERDD